MFIGAKMLTSPLVRLDLGQPGGDRGVAAGAVAASLSRNRSRGLREPEPRRVPGGRPATEPRGRCARDRAGRPAGRVADLLRDHGYRPGLEAVLPVLPSETAVIALGVATADSADPRITLLLACCAAGALVGDILCYLVGRRFGAAHRGTVLPGAGRARSGAPGPSAAAAMRMPLRLDQVVIPAVNAIRRSFRVQRATQRELSGERSGGRGPRPA